MAWSDPGVDRNDPMIKFLLSANDAKLELVRLKEKVRKADSKVKKVTSTLSWSPPGGGNKESTPEWADWVEVRRQYILMMARCELIEQQVYSFVRQIHPAVHQEILYLRYCCGLSWSKLYDRLAKDGYDYDDRHVRKLHTTAIQKAHVLWDDLQKRGEKP